MSKITLYDYWRSSASYRVRIALNLAGLPFETVSVDIFKGDHRLENHLKRNPQSFVPVINIDNQSFTQSLSIIEYLNETRGLDLLPKDHTKRARVTALAYAIAIDIHPICNLSVSSYAEEISGEENYKQKWMKKFIGPGLEAFEKLLEDFPKGSYSVGDTPSLPDICLIPQIYNAMRWEVDIAHLSRINSIIQSCNKHPAFINAHPDFFKPS